MLGLPRVCHRGCISPIALLEYCEPIKISWSEHFDPVTCALVSLVQHVESTWLMRDQMRIPDFLYVIFQIVRAQLLAFLSSGSIHHSWMIRTNRAGKARSTLHNLPSLTFGVCKSLFILVPICAMNSARYPLYALSTKTTFFTAVPLFLSGQCCTKSRFH